MKLVIIYIYVSFEHDYIFKYKFHQKMFCLAKEIK
jgi:hypothetical protein